MKRQNYKLIFNLVITIFLTLGLSISFQSLLAQTWSAPTDNPPDGMVGTGFVTLTNSNQIKIGGLEILSGATTTNLNISNELLVSGDTYFKKMDIYGDPGSTTLIINTVSSGPATSPDAIVMGNSLTGNAYGIGTDYNGSFRIDRVSNAGAPNFIVDSGDRVGIGIWTPSQKLDVGGNIRTTGNFLGDQICDTSGSNCKTLTLGWELESVSVSKTVNQATDEESDITATCNTGYRVTGGSCVYHYHNRGELYITESRLSGNGWFCEGHNHAGGTMPLVATAICTKIVQ